MCMVKHFEKITRRDAMGRPVVSKHALIDSMKSTITDKDKEIASLKAKVATKDAQISVLKEKIASPRALLEQYMNRTDERIASLEASLKDSIPYGSTVDLTGEEVEQSTRKRPRIEDVARSNYAVRYEQQLNQKIVKVKAERDTAESALENVREEKRAVEREKNAALLALECKICFEVKDENFALVPCKVSCASCPTCSSNINSHLRLYGR